MRGHLLISESAELPQSGRITHNVKSGSWVESVGNLKGIREGLVKVKGRHWTTTQDTAGFAWS